ncbi:MAG: UDP-glucose 4-epimerase [Solirubrobacterales bacterium]|jgi:ferritin-like metal-binding protein YciE/nucleoside-diphosphate-sugar epimerase|nr:UDP-glucose 4-epimerase [Solirubrobacterales bacterium]
MKIVVTGATGNVGTSVIEALSALEEIEELIGLARRAPAWKPEKTNWVNADVVSSPLEPVFEGADAVIHLAWAIQPSHDLETLERINVDGSRRVFEAVAAAGVPKLIYASSVGAYAPGPKEHLVTEDWPVGGTETSFYSRHKALVEEQLDQFEARVPDTKVIRLRPALIFKGEAATEIRRLFAGPFLPTFLLRSGRIPAIPRLPGLCFQAVHTSDVGRAYALAAIRDVSGAFNLAANPPLGIEDLAATLDARTFPLPVSVARRLADLTWRLHLQPTPAGWLDMAMDVPLMSSERAEQELGWQPQVSAIEALAELIGGLRNGNGKPTPPLESSGPGGRFDELRTGVGGRQWVHGPNEKLVKQLADVHSIEEQALTQMRKAPKIAGDERLAEVFEEHLSETEEQERRVRERLEAHGADPSTMKDLAGKAGGIGMIVFAASQPDTPGKLAAHAFSYEHMEIAAYELLRRTAEEAGDEATAAMAGQIAAEEQRMADRLEAGFDAAVAASLNGDSEAELSSQLNRYLADAHAIEKQGLQLLETAPKIVKDTELKELFGTHLRQSEEHEQLIRERLEARGAKPSKAKDAVLRLGGLQVGAFFAAQPDTTAKLTGFAFAFEHLEIAAYELLERVAKRAGDQKVLSVAERILAEERATAGNLASHWDRASSPAKS